MEFIKKIIKALTPMSQDQINEQYLNEATSVHDLEWRMKELDRNNYERSRNFPTHNGSY